jgi:hypothetical protein
MYLSKYSFVRGVFGDALPSLVQVLDGAHVVVDSAVDTRVHLVLASWVVLSSLVT